LTPPGLGHSADGQAASSNSIVADLISLSNEEEPTAARQLLAQSNRRPLCRLRLV
jgi:hypothetical protein